MGDKEPGSTSAASPGPKKYVPPHLRDKASAEPRRAQWAPERSAPSATPSQGLRPTRGSGSGSLRPDARSNPQHQAPRAPLQAGSSRWRRSHGGADMDKSKNADTVGQKRPTMHVDLKPAQTHLAVSRDVPADSPASASSSPYPDSGRRTGTPRQAGLAGASIEAKWRSLISRTRSVSSSDSAKRIATLQAVFDDIREGFSFPLNTLSHHSVGLLLAALGEAVIAAAPEDSKSSVVAPQPLQADSISARAANPDTMRFTVLVYDYFGLLGTCVLRQQAVFEDQHHELLVGHVCQLLQICTRRQWPLADGLRVLSFLLFDHGSKLTRHHSALLQVLLPLLYDAQPEESKDKMGNTAQVEFEARRIAISCLGNICIGVDASSNLDFGAIFVGLMTNLHRYLKTPNGHEDVRITKLLATVLRAICSVIQEAKTVHEGDVVSLVSALRKTISWGVGSSLQLSAAHLGMGVGLGIGARVASSAAAHDKSAQDSTGGYVSSGSVGSSTEDRRAVGSLQTRVQQGLDHRIRREAHALSPFFSPSLFSRLETNKWPLNVGKGGGRHTPSWLASELDSSDADAGAASLSDGSAWRSGTDGGALAVLAAKVRTHTIQTVRAIAQNTPRVFQQHWFEFIPTDRESALSQRPFSGPHLMTVLLHDPSPKVRNTAAVALAAVMEVSPLLTWSGKLGGAATMGIKSKGRKATVGSGTSHTQAFASLSVRFADSIGALHHGLCVALQRHTTVAARSQTLNCIASLVANAPYQQLESIASSSNGANQLLVPIVRELSLMLSGSVVALRHAVFSCLSAIFDTREPLTELETLLTSGATAHAGEFGRGADKTERKGTVGADDVVECLMGQAYKRVPGDPTPDAFTVLSKIAHLYPLALTAYWRWGERDSTPELSLSHLCLSSLHRPQDADTGVLGLRLLEEWVRVDISRLNDVSRKPKVLLSTVLGVELSDAAASSHADTDESKPSLFDMSASAEDNDSPGGKASSPSPFFGVEGAMEVFGTHLLDAYTAASAGTPNQNEPGSTAASVRAKVLSCLSYVPESVWIALPIELREKLLDLFLGATEDAVPAVRTVACRGLGVYGVFLSVALSFPEYVQNAAAKLVKMLAISHEPVMSVRVRACWALANICDRSAAHLLADYAKSCRDSSALDTLPLPTEPASPAFPVSPTPEASLEAPASPVPRQKNQHLNLTPITPPRRPAVSLKNEEELKQELERERLQEEREWAGVPYAATIAHTMYLDRLLSEDGYHRILQEMLWTTNGQEKIITNAVRALGHIARWMKTATPPPSMSPSRVRSPQNARTMGVPEEVQLWCRICNVFSEGLVTTKSVKSQWNICYAIGNLLSSPILPKLLKYSRPQTQLRDLIDSLLKTVRTCKNFKVRINAAQALASPPTRHHYGVLYPSVWQRLCDALSDFEQQESSSFGQYRYRESLQKQLVFTLFKCICMASDFPQELRAMRVVRAHQENMFEVLRKNVSFLAALVHREEQDLARRSLQSPRRVAPPLKKVANAAEVSLADVLQTKETLQALYTSVYTSTKEPADQEILSQFQTSVLPDSSVELAQHPATGAEMKE